MQVIIPLAGPDFVSPDGAIKGLIPFQGKSLLKFVLDSRPWAHKVKHYVFVLYDCLESRQFASNFLASWYKDSSFVFLTTFSQGAAMSALSGLSVLRAFSKPLIIDLADIYYQSNMDVENLLLTTQNIGALGVVFTSDNPQYSYLACDDYGVFVNAAEKKVISDQASAGTYIFKSSAIFLQSIAHAIENEHTQTYDNLFYVCPLFNGVRAQGKQVALHPVSNIIDIKLYGLHEG
jgi:hypothetical protein